VGSNILDRGIKSGSISDIYSPFHFFGRGFSTSTFLVVSALLMFMSFLKPSAMTGIKTGIYDAFLPALEIISKPFSDIAELAGSVSKIATIKEENKRLEAENTKLKEWYQAALLLEAENHSLQELLNLKLDPVHKYITTRVVSDSGNSYVKTVIIASGEEDNVKRGQAVLAGEGMIGRVIEAGKKASRVLLITDFNSRIPVLIEGSRQKGILAGTNRDFPILTHLPPDSEISEGMRVVPSGHGGFFPQGIPIGKVSIGDDNKIYVDTNADINRVTHVRVVDFKIEHSLDNDKTN
jgi:rod shape-determining protein MreC